jgi:GntR family transcriptional repressor for pyruvate dehydrogenase complex
MSGTQDILPVERSSIAEQVAKKLLDLIRSGNLKPGDLLPTERDLAVAMQVSRPSVREAVRGLQILGVLKVRQGSGTYVSPLDAADLLGPLQFLLTLNAENIDALYEIRLLIDMGAARKAAERITPADLIRLKQMVVVQRKLVSDPLGFRVSDLIRSSWKRPKTRSWFAPPARSIFWAWSIVVSQARRRVCSNDLSRITR